jgi:tripartite-type tricarboxylate transporter receptor subunit TctC
MKPIPRSLKIRRAGLGVAVVAALASMAGLPAPAQAQPYPSKPIRMIVPLAAGSAVDVAARRLAIKMSTNMGQNIVVENVVGAAGIIGAQQLAKAAPDGYTIGGFNDSILTMVPNLNPNTPFNPVTDFAHISQVATIEFSISVAINSPFKSAADVIAAAKASPGKLTYGSGGIGSPQHLAGALFASHTGIDLKHIPYRGASQAAQGAASGEVDMNLNGIATVSSLAKAGKLRLIGVMRDTRHPEYPDAPTVAEAGVKGFDFSTWFSLTAPKGTPREIIDRLHREVVSALTDAELKERFSGLGLRPDGTSPEQVTRLVETQLARYAKAVKDNNIKAE